MRNDLSGVGSDIPLSLSGIVLTLLSIPAAARRRGPLARACMVVYLPVLGVIATMTAIAVMVAVTLWRRNDVMAKQGGRVVPGPGGESPLPPCATAGDDRVGPDSPPWVQPAAGGNGRGFLGASDPGFHERYPTLHDFLTLTGWGGKQRKTGTILVFAEDGKWKACVNDRDGGNYCFGSADSFSGLLEALERGLKGGSLDWRASKSRR